MVHDPAQLAQLAALATQVHIWLAYPERIAPARLIEQYLPILSENETARFHRFHFERDRLHFLSAHALLRHALSHYAPLQPQQWRFEHGPQGKPEIAATPDIPPLQFNLSHTNGLVACCVTLGRRCGVDVEHLRPMKDAEGVAQMVFSGVENAFLQKREADKREAAFFSLWTLKEAYIKATGQGLSAPLKDISFDIEAGVPSVSFGGAVADHPAHWLFQKFIPTPNHLMAIAAHPGTGLDGITIHEWDLNTAATNGMPAWHAISSTS